MIADILTLEELTQRLIKLEESKSNIFITHLPILLSTIAIVISAIALVLRIKKNSYDNLKRINDNIDTSELKLREKSIELNEFLSQKKINKNQVEKTINEYLLDVLSKYNDGCKEFHNNKTFREKYHESIVKYVETQEKYFSDITSYLYMKNYYLKYHKHQK